MLFDPPATTYVQIMAMLIHKSAGWSIRPHTRADHAQIAGVFEDCLTAFPWRNKSYEMDALAHALRHASVLVAEEKQAGIVGFLILQADNGYVSHLFVQEDWRFCGIGRGLLQTARSLAGRPLYLDVDEQNRNARAAYRALGWAESVDQTRQPGNMKRLFSP